MGDWTMQMAAEITTEQATEIDAALTGMVTAIDTATAIDVIETETETETETGIGTETGIETDPVGHGARVGFVGKTSDPTT